MSPWIRNWFTLPCLAFVPVLTLLREHRRPRPPRRLRPARPSPAQPVHPGHPGDRTLIEGLAEEGRRQLRRDGD